MQKQGVEILGKREIKEVKKQGAVVRKEGGTEEFIPADNVVLATGFEPKDSLKDIFSKKLSDIEVYSVGDCVEARKLYEAIQEGYQVGSTI